MIKWIVLGVLLYLICGCIIAFVMQQLYNSENPDKSCWGIPPDDVPFAIIVWPLCILILFVAVGAPVILMGLYKLFITVIFLIIALFKKEEKND